MTASLGYIPYVQHSHIYKNPDDISEPVLVRSDKQPLTLFPVQLKVNNQSQTANLQLRMIGPGDVTGIDPRAVIRVDPPPKSSDFEPNYMACIEFDTPDFPWLFTPATSGTNGRLRPWLILAVVEVREDVHIDSVPGQPLPVLTAPTSELPDLTESWAWAHTQVIQSDAPQPIEKILTDLPNQNLSRLICPRYLKPATHYIACLVPAFDVGRKTGLGMEITEAEQNALTPAWDNTQPQVRLPVYYQWEFSTGSGGDFESLAERLVGRPAPAGLGRRSLRVENQPFNLPNMEGLYLEGALTSIDKDDSAGFPEPDESFQETLRDLLNLSKDQKVVTPPIYGRWQASQTSVPGKNEQPAWLRQLNLNPAYRAAAGLGQRVVQEHQEQLVASAWDQLGDVRTVGQLEQRLDLTVALLKSVIDRRLNKMDVGRLIQFLGPAHSRIRMGSETLHARLINKGLPASFSSPAFRRALRPATTLSRRIAFSQLPDTSKLAIRISTEVPNVNPPTNQHPATSTNVQKLQIPGVLNATQQRYQTAAIAVQDYFNKFNRRKTEQLSTPFTFEVTLKPDLMTNLAPRSTAPQRVYARVSTAKGGVLAPPKSGESIIPGVTFPQPMYEALRDISSGYLLPGVEHLEADTVTLLTSNARFIESFMIGLNHEMAGELNWRDFRGPRKQTYFTSFWDIRGSLQSTEQFPAIHEWQLNSGLGSHFSLAGDQLVLLIKGQLLMRYPNTLIYAIKAKSLSEIDTKHQKFPIFRGRIEPDITFLGFDLAADEARGTSGDPGWFFAIQEQPGAPRFGMDASRKPDGQLTHWNDLAWSDISTLPGSYLSLKPLDLTVPSPNNLVWKFNSAHMAAILYQQSVRVSIHARRLLPPAESIPHPPIPPRPPVPSTSQEVSS